MRQIKPQGTDSILSQAKRAEILNISALLCSLILLLLGKKNVVSKLITTLGKQNAKQYLGRRQNLGVALFQVM